MALIMIEMVTAYSGEALLNNIFEDINKILVNQNLM